MNQDHTDNATSTAHHFAEFPADGQVDTSTLSTQALRQPQLQASEASEQHNNQVEKFEPVQSKEPSSEDQVESVPANKYNKLKRQFSALREEYLQTISGWEQCTKQLENLTHERKFLRKKLQFFLASKYNSPQISDEELTAMLLSQSAALQSRPANPGRSSTQISIGKARNGAAQILLNGIAGFDDAENGGGEGTGVAKLQRHMKNMTEQEREKFVEELQNNSRRNANEKQKKGSHAPIDHQSLLAQQSSTEGEQSSKIKISFAQLNGPQAKPIKATQKMSSANNMVSITAKQQKQLQQQQQQQQSGGSSVLPQLPPASSIVPPQQQQQQHQQNGIVNVTTHQLQQYQQQQYQQQQQPQLDQFNRVNLAAQVKP